VDRSSLALYRNDEFIDSVDSTSGFFSIPEGPARFRLQQEWALSDSFARSKNASTIWEFDSAPPADPSQGFETSPPLMAVDYIADVDGLGRVDPRRSLRLDLDVSHKVGSERIDSLHVWWSTDDGETWQRSKAKRTSPTSFQSKIRGNALRPGDSLSLRVAATDAVGDSVDQTVIGIFPVR
jgi:hypothetical protein